MAVVVVVVGERERERDKIRAMEDAIEAQRLEHFRPMLMVLFLLESFGSGWNTRKIKEKKIHSFYYLVGK